MISKIQKLDKPLFLLCLVALLTVQGMLRVGAEDAEVTEEDATSEEDFACGQAMIEQGSVIVEDYETFLDELFKVDTPSSGQVEEAMTYYRYVEDALNNIFSDNLHISGFRTLDFANTNATYCTYIRDQYLDFAQTLLQKQILLSANSKRTFEIIDGLKAMNENIENLYEDFHAVFPGLFNQMNNALPCYARQCITQ